MKDKLNGVVKSLLTLIRGQAMNATFSGGKRFDQMTSSEQLEFDAALKKEVSGLGPRSDAWAMEIFRTLVIINGAGMAGAFAIMQRQGFPISWMVFGSYTSGLFFALVAMFLNFAIYRDISRSLTINRGKFIAGEIGKNDFMQELPDWERRNSHPVYAGLISLGSFVLASLWLFLLIVIYG